MSAMLCPSCLRWHQIVLDTADKGEYSSVGGGGGGKIKDFLMIVRFFSQTRANTLKTSKFYRETYKKKSFVEECSLMNRVLINTIVYLSTVHSGIMMSGYDPGIVPLSISRSASLRRPHNFHCSSIPGVK